jgi:hypothetical protein
VLAARNQFAKTRLGPLRPLLLILFSLAFLLLLLQRLAPGLAQELLLRLLLRPLNRHLQTLRMATVVSECWLGLRWLDLQHFWLAFCNKLGFTEKWRMNCESARGH